VIHCHSDAAGEKRSRADRQEAMIGERLMAYWPSKEPSRVLGANRPIFPCSRGLLPPVIKPRGLNREDKRIPRARAKYHAERIRLQISERKVYSAAARTKRNAKLHARLITLDKTSLNYAWFATLNVRRMRRPSIDASRLNGAWCATTKCAPKMRQFRAMPRLSAITLLFLSFSSVRSKL